MQKPADGIVANLQIEAVAQSQSAGDIMLKVVFTPSGPSSLTASDTVKLTAIAGDLTISEIRVVQVIEDVPLVKDKTAIARVFAK